MLFNLKEFVESIKNLLGSRVLGEKFEFDELSIILDSRSIAETLVVLKENNLYSFHQLVDITAVDYPNRINRFEIVYHLLSHKNNQRLRIKACIKDTEPIESVSSIFPSATWYEREVWDLFGIPFINHPDLRRILNDYNFEGHPLRKDFPLVGFIEVGYNEITKSVAYNTVNLNQDFRTFNFPSSWKGNINKKDSLDLDREEFSNE